MMKKNYVVFAGSASTKLAKEMAAVLNMPIGKTELSRFTNSECRLRILSKVKGKNCLVIQSTAQPVNDNLMELFLLVDTLKRAGAKEIVGLIPYFGYSRQHKSFRNGESVTAKMILKILANLGVRKVITFDLHNLDLAKSSYPSVENISLLPVMAKAVAKKIDPSNTVVMSPDEGGFERAKIFAENFYNKGQASVVMIEKRRNLHRLHEVKHKTATGLNLKGKAVVIVDDMCTTGKTLFSAVDVCSRLGARQVYAAITHADMDELIMQKIEKSRINKFFTTATIENYQGFRTAYRKLEIIDISQMLKMIKSLL